MITLRNPNDTKKKITLAANLSCEQEQPNLIHPSAKYHNQAHHAAIYITMQLILTRGGNIHAYPNGMNNKREPTTSLVDAD
ncbi:hypothetical protein ACJX0J_026652 [Zea mays]